MKNHRHPEPDPVLEHFEDRVDYWSRVYQEDSFAGHTLRKRQDFCLNFLRRHLKGGKILDLGCGTGGLSIVLAQEGYQVSGIDQSPKMIEKAKEQALLKGVSCDFQIGTAEKLFHPTRHFDALIAMGLLEYIEDPAKVFQEIARVLKPGGLLLINMPNSFSFYRFVAFPRSLPILLGPNFKRRVRAMEKRLKLYLGLRTKGFSRAWLGRSATPCSFMKCLEKAGFHSVDFFSLTYGPFHPFGIRCWSERKDIEISEKLSQKSQPHLYRWGASLVIYSGVRSES